jgi:hypothetical protein
MAYRTKNSDGNIVTEYIPIDVYHDWFYKPLVWQYYDDLHKNIPDEKKIEIDHTILHKYFEINPSLEEQMKIEFPKEYGKFEELKKNKEEKTPAKMEKDIENRETIIRRKLLKKSHS